MSRKPFTMLLSASLSLGWALALAGCKPDICADSTLTQVQRCQNCVPKKSKEDEVLARLNPTQLPWPVRKNIEGCVDKHADDLFITKQGLRECIETDSNLDADTKMSVLQLIQRSNVMEQADLENFHANCSVANLNASTHVNITPASPMVPPPARFESAPPPAAWTTPAPPVARPAPAPAAAPSAPRPSSSPPLAPAVRPAPPAARPASPLPPPPPAPADPFM